MECRRVEGLGKGKARVGYKKSVGVEGAEGVEDVEGGGIGQNVDDMLI